MRQNAAFREMPRTPRYVKPFDPWRATSLCTCPFKYTVNPYTGCAHGCLYCYASSYIKRFFEPRPKANFLRLAAEDLRKVPRGSILNISSSSDPYQPLELTHGYTRRLLELASGSYVVEVVTKSDLVIRDVDLLARGPSVVSLTITTLDESLAARLEPRAPPPGRRLRAVEKLSENDIPVVVRVDPLIPGLNDAPESVKEVLEAVAAAGARHVVSSTYKARPESLRRLSEAFPDLIPRLRELYAQGGERIHGYLYAPAAYRYRTLARVREQAHRLNLTFAQCREGFPELIDPGISCDGTHLALSRRALSPERKSREAGVA
ncbi:MAG: radical SAM protein [Thermofilum sp.]